MSTAIERKQTAIMFTDIVGYSLLFNNIEDEAYQLLQEHNKLIEPFIHKNSGLIVKYIGDSVFAYFDSCEDCANAAIDIQKALIHRNKLSKVKDKISLRIGLHYGEVIINNNDLFGNEVNICSRIESISDQSGILVSDVFLKELSKTKYYYRTYGQIKLKNIVNPILLHKLYIDEKEYRSESDDIIKSNIIDKGINVVNADEYKAIEIFSFALLFPENLAGIEHDALCYYFIENFLNTMGKIKNVRVTNIFDIERVKNLKNNPMDIGIKLESRYVGVSNFNFIDNKILIRIQLFDLNSGEVVYKSSKNEYENRIEFLIRDIIIDMSNVTGFSIPDQLFKFLSNDQSIDNTAFSNFVDAKFLSDHVNKAGDLEKSETLLRKVIEIEPQFVKAYASLGMTLNLMAKYNDAEEMLEVALEKAQDYGDFDSKSMVYNYMGILYKYQKKYKRSIRQFEKAIELQNKLDDKLFLAKINVSMAGSYSRMGDSDKAILLLKKGVDIFKELERYDSLGNTYAEIAQTYNMGVQYSDAIEYFKYALPLFELQNMRYRKMMVHVILTEIYIYLGLDDLAGKLLSRSNELYGDFHDDLTDGRLAVCESRLYFNQNDYTSAISFSKNAIDSFQTANKPQLIIYELIFLSIVYYLDNDKKQSLQCIERAQNLDKTQHVGQVVLTSELIKVFILEEKDINKNFAGLDQMNIKELYLLTRILKVNKHDSKTVQKINKLSQQFSDKLRISKHKFSFENNFLI